MEALLVDFRASLSDITAPRFYQSECGYQGVLLAALNVRVRLPDRAIVEQEYQKRLLDHGIKLRPDIVIHRPFDPERNERRNEGNFAVVELKLNPSPKGAMEDFSNLLLMLELLRYQTGIFVNIDSDRTFADLVPQDARGRLVCFATSLENGHVRIVEERV